MKSKSIIKIWTIVVLMPIIVCFAVAASEAQQQVYPTKPIVIIVPFPPGGATDLVPRIYAPPLSRKWGIPITILNKPGGQSIVGTLEAMQAKPDGYTLMSDVPGASSSLLAFEGEKLPFKVENRTFIARIVSLPMTIVVRADSPWRNLDDVAETIRKNPTSFKWGSSGTSIVDVVLLQLKKAFGEKGIDVSKTKEVTFQGADAITSLGGGHIDIHAGTFAMVGSMASAGKIRIIAVCGTERYKGHPDIKTTVEQGYSSVYFANWIGLSGPPGLPENVVQTCINGLKELLNNPDMVESFAKIGAVPSLLGGNDFRKFVLDEATEMKALFKISK